MAPRKSSTPKLPPPTPTRKSSRQHQSSLRPSSSGPPPATNSGRPPTVKQRPSTSAPSSAPLPGPSSARHLVAAKTPSPDGASGQQRTMHERIRTELSQNLDFDSRSEWKRRDEGKLAVMKELGGEVNFFYLYEMARTKMGADYMWNVSGRKTKAPRSEGWCLADVYKLIEAFGKYYVMQINTAKNQAQLHTNFRNPAFCAHWNDVCGYPGEIGPGEGEYGEFTEGYNNRLARLWVLHAVSDGPGTELERRRKMEKMAAWEDPSDKRMHQHVLHNGAGYNTAVPGSDDWLKCNPDLTPFIDEAMGCDTKKKEQIEMDRKIQEKEQLELDIEVLRKEKEDLMRTMPEAGEASSQYIELNGVKFERCDGKKSKHLEKKVEKVDASDDDDDDESGGEGKRAANDVKDAADYSRRLHGRVQTQLQLKLAEKTRSGGSESGEEESESDAEKSTSERSDADRRGTGSDGNENDSMDGKLEGVDGEDAETDETEQSGAMSQPRRALKKASRKRIATKAARKRLPAVSNIAQALADTEGLAPDDQRRLSALQADASGRQSGSGGRGPRRSKGSGQAPRMQLATKAARKTPESSEVARRGSGKSSGKRTSKRNAEDEALVNEDGARVEAERTRSSRQRRNRAAKRRKTNASGEAAVASESNRAFENPGLSNVGTDVGGAGDGDEDDVVYVGSTPPVKSTSSVRRQSR